MAGLRRRARPSVASVGVLELTGVLIPRHDPPKQRTGAVELGDSALDDFLDRSLQGDQEVFAVLGLGDLPDPLTVQGSDILGLDRGRFSRAAQRGQDQEVDVGCLSDSSSGGALAGPSRSRNP